MDLNSAPPQTGGLHESFGDLTAIFLALSQLDQVEAVIAQTKADLHDKTFLADMAEQFGLALGRPNGLRNADNDLTLSDAGNEVHAISQVFTGAIYDILADIFAFERQPGLHDDAAVLHLAGSYVCSLVLRALVAAPDVAATYPHVVQHMLRLAEQDGKPAEYRSFIRQRFTLRQVIAAADDGAEFMADAAIDGGADVGTDGGGAGVAAGVEASVAAGGADAGGAGGTADGGAGGTGAGADGAGGGVRESQAPIAAARDAAAARQDRRACCGTLNHAEYFALEDVLDAERRALAAWCQAYRQHGSDAPPAEPLDPAASR